MREKIKGFLPLAFLVAVLLLLWLPKRMEQRACNQFGEPLFSHALPEDTVLIQKDAAKDDAGGVTAALLLKTGLSSEDLFAFYSDGVYPPAQEGQTVTLDVKPLDESSMEALKQAKLYEEGASYQFVYLYSR